MLKKCYPLLIFLILGSIRPVFSQVDLPTGRATFNVPIFHYDDANRLTFDMSLNYTGGAGIKVNQIPSCVGLGWDLMAGGIIVRRTIGEPDDLLGGTYGGIPYGPGYLTPNLNILQPIPAKAGFVPTVSSPTPYYKPDSTITIDLQQDVFTFQIGNRSGSFTIRPNGNLIILDNSRLKIERVEKDMRANHILTSISSFIITDESGIRYTFSATGTSKIVSYRSAAKQLTTTGQVFIGQQHRTEDYSVINEWYLSQIYDPLSKNKVTLTYSDYNLEYIAGYEGIYSNQIINGSNNYVNQIFEDRFAGTKKQLSTISISKNNVRILFKYSDNSIVDLNGQKALQLITVQQDGVEQNGYQFNYCYFMKDSTRSFDYAFEPENIKYARLCLSSVQRTAPGGIREAPHVFSYYNKLDNYGEIVGIPGRSIGGKDHWGYFNFNTYLLDFSTTDMAWKSTRNLSLEYNRRVNPDLKAFAKLGALMQVKFPSGGILQYEYENNVAKTGTTTALSGGIRVRRTILKNMVDALQDRINDYRYVEADSTSSGWGYETPRYVDTAYSYLVITPGEAGYLPQDYSYAVGRSLTSTLLSSEFANASSFGEIAGGLAYSIVGAIVVRFIIDWLTPPPSPKQMAISSFQEVSTHKSKVNPLPHLYDRVEVYSGSTQNNIGRTVYEFTSPTDFPLVVPVQYEPFSLKPRCLPWVYGLPKRTLELGKNNKPVSELLYTYSQTGPLSNGATSNNWKVKRALMCPQIYFNTYSSVGIELVKESYSHLCGRVDLQGTTAKKYDSTGSFIQTNTKYINNPINYLPSIISTVTSTGDTLQSRIYYPGDYNAVNFPVLKVMKDANLFSLPIAKEVWKINSSGQKLVDASISEYKVQTSGDIKIEQQYTFQNSGPVDAAIAGTFNPAILNRIPAYIKKQQSLNYDDNGSLVHRANPNGVEAGYKLDADQQVVAAVQNAHTNHVEKNASSGVVTNGSILLSNPSPKTVTFTLAQSGSFYLQLETPPPYEGRLISYSLTGGTPAVSKSGRLCNVDNSVSLTESFAVYKDTIPGIIAFTNLPAGSYSLTVAKIVDMEGQSSINTNITYSYFTDPFTTVNTQFFYNGFENDPLPSGFTSPYAGYSFKVGPYTVPFTMPDARAYKLDYRYRNAGKWVYTSKVFTNNMVISEDTIDEVRVYPVDSRFASYTFDVAGKVTSETTNDGYCTFYEYDPSGRLSIIRDQDYNILKRICYNYAGQPEQCGGSTYGNVQMSQTFTKQGCGPGFTAEPYLYIVPANKYITDDQDVSNYKALEEIRINGQKTTNQSANCVCAGEDHKVINGICEKGFKVNFIDVVDGGSRCRKGYWYKFSDGTYSAKTYGEYVVCP